MLKADNLLENLPTSVDVIKKNEIVGRSAMEQAQKDH